MAVGVLLRWTGAAALALGLSLGAVQAQAPAAPPAAEAKPQEAKPQEAKPAEAKPEEPEKKEIIALDEMLKPGPIPEFVLGDDKAPIVIVEYASLTCPHCATFHTRTFDFLKKVYIDTGKVRFFFRDFPFDGVALAGTMLSRCVAEAEGDKTKGRDRFFAITETLFFRQATWAFGTDPEAELIKIAKEYGLSQEKFDACLQNQSMYEGVLEVRKRAHEVFKVNSTPTIFVNGEPFRGALTPEQMDTVLKRIIAEKK